MGSIFHLRQDWLIDHVCEAFYSHTTLLMFTFPVQKQIKIPLSNQRKSVFSPLTSNINNVIILFISPFRINLARFVVICLVVTSQKTLLPRLS